MSSPTISTTSHTKYTHHTRSTHSDESVSPLLIPRIEHTHSHICTYTRTLTHRAEAWFSIPSLSLSSSSSWSLPVTPDALSLVTSASSFCRRDLSTGIASSLTNTFFQCVSASVRQCVSLTHTHTVLSRCARIISILLSLLLLLSAVWLLRVYVCAAALPPPPPPNSLANQKLT